MSVYDCFTFNGEMDMLEIRFNILSPFVDKFVIVEGFETFSGLHKPFYWEERDKERFKSWEDKVIYHKVTNYLDESIIKQAAERESYVNTNPFKRAFYQKESIRIALEQQHLKEDDVIYYGDIDEVWTSQEVDDKPHKLRQLAYSYYLNNRSPEDWRGTIVTKWGNIKCLNDLRANPVEADILENGGWHFTNLGGLEMLKNKIQSYDHQEVNVPYVTEGLEERMKTNEDFLGRGFKFWIDDSQLPEYILNNKLKWKHLWK